jgi:hypothetical protein
MKLTATTRGSWISEGMASIAAIGKVERRGRLVLVAIFCYVAVVEKVKGGYAGKIGKSTSHQFEILIIIARHRAPTDVAVTKEKTNGRIVIP